MDAILLGNPSMIADAARVTASPPMDGALIEKRRTGARVLHFTRRHHTGQEAPPERGAKILLYSHDAVGLGSMWRTRLVSEALKRALPGAAVVVVTGSPAAQVLPFPAGVEHVALPWLGRETGDDEQTPEDAAWYPEVRRMRRAILRATASSFDPNLIIVDQRPAGVESELLGTLAALRKRRRRPRVVLGLKDIPASPTRARRSPLLFHTIDRYYDEVWVYGVRDVFDTVQEHAFPDTVAEKTVFCGYLDALPARDALAKPVHAPPALPADRVGPHVLVLPGCGVDGSRVIEHYLQGLLQLPRRCALRTTVVLGGVMPADKRTALLERFGMLPDVTFLDAAPAIERRYAQADLVVSTAGYDRVCELLSFGQRAVLVPRTDTRGDELTRARRFGELGYFDVIGPDELESGRLIAAVMGALGRHAAVAPPVDMGGLFRVVERARLLSGTPIPSATAS